MDPRCVGDTMKTAVRRVLLMSALLSPGALYALGLGEIHLNSSLNQPFDADIELVAATQDDLGALRAGLANNDVFARYGLDRPAYLSEFSFQVTKGANGQDILKVTSPRPVTEPFVTLLVEANWSRGRLLREYTVLLDPPVFAPTPASAEPAVVPPRASTAPATRVDSFNSGTQTAATAGEPRSVRSAEPMARLEGGASYRVRPNDTLWGIASNANPGSRADVNRAMVAIYQGNPQAFDGNINVLRAGSVLKIPQASEVASISAAAASAEVARQYQLWRDGSVAAGQADSTTGRLRLVTPEQGTAAPSTTAPVAAPPGAQAQPGALGTRVKQLEGELAEARRLLEVRNAELATLQGQVAAAGRTPAQGVTPRPEAGAKPSPEAATSAPGVTPVQPESTAAPVAEEPPQPAEAAPPKPEVKPAPASTPKPESKPAAEGPSLIERALEYWWLLLGLLVAAGAFALFQSNRRKSGDGTGDLEETFGRDLRGARPAPAPRESSIVVEEKRPMETPAPVAPVAPLAARASEASRQPVSMEDTLSGEGPASIEAGDPLAEADFHMAYGLYDQAADLVQLAIKREPQRRDLKLKLLEIFFVWGNRDRFLDLAREMKSGSAEGAVGEWDKILIMGKQIAPEDPLFAASPRATEADLDMELHAAAGTLDMDLISGEGPEPDLDLTAREPRPGDGTGIDFVIDEPVRGAEDPASLAPTVEMVRPSLSPPDERSVIVPTIKTAAFGLSGGDETEEVSIESLGLDIDAHEALGELDKDDDTLRRARRVKVDDTVEAPLINLVDRAGDTVEQDLLSSTSLMKLSASLTADDHSSDTSETAMIDLSGATGELPTVETPRLAPDASVTEDDFSIAEEAATMSEVGTKLDLARAYLDMGDPEGARAILDEVLQEGNAVQKQEAQRLMVSLP
jgi:pilus assembly protein FimV